MAYGKHRDDRRHTDDDDFNIRSQEELASMMNSTTDMMTILLGCVAGISLIVGGIGIMNIMYVSVTERTREIGLRMSVGARGVDILNQFLIEAILLSVTGGLIGVAFGVGASYAVQSAAGKLGLVLRSVAQFIFGREFPVLAVVAAFLLLTVSWLLLRHQQVEN